MANGQHAERVGNGQGGAGGSNSNLGVGKELRMSSSTSALGTEPLLPQLRLGIIIWQNAGLVVS